MTDNAFSNQFAQAVDFYLSPGGQPHIEAIYRIASQQSSQETDALLLGYALEGIRMAGPSGIYRQATAVDAFTEDDGREVKVQPGDRIFVSFASAARDENLRNPDTIDPRRPLDSYINYGAEPHMRLGRDVSEVALVELFRALFRKKGLRRVPGPQGELKRVPGPGDYSVFMTEDWGGLWPFPTAMKVVWDGE